MQWLVFILLSAFFNSLMDLFTKISSDKIHAGFGSLLVCLFAAIPTTIYTIYAKLNRQEILITKTGIIFSMLAGLTVGIATIFIYQAFSGGINLSVAVPILRISMIIIAAGFGVFLLKEGINLKLILGLTISIIGIYLILNAKA